MRSGDLIIIKKFVNKNGFREERKAVVLEVSKKDIDNGLNVLKPGLYAFHGMWYGKDPLDHRSYGKIAEACGRIVGNVRGRHQRVIRQIS